MWQRARCLSHGPGERVFSLGAGKCRWLAGAAPDPTTSLLPGRTCPRQSTAPGLVCEGLQSAALVCSEVSFDSLKDSGWSLLDVSVALTTKEMYQRSLRLLSQLQDLWRGLHGDTPKAWNTCQLICALPSLLVGHPWVGGVRGWGSGVVTEGEE